MCLVRSVLGEKNGNSNNSKKQQRQIKLKLGKYKNYLEPLSEEWLEREVQSYHTICYTSLAFNGSFKPSLVRILAIQPMA